MTETTRNFCWDSMGKPSEQVTNLLFEWHKEPTKETTNVKALRENKQKQTNPHSLFNNIEPRLGYVGAFPGTQDIEVNKQI